MAQGLQLPRRGHVPERLERVRVDGEQQRQQQHHHHAAPNTLDAVV